MVAFYKHHIPAWMDGTEKLDDGPYRAYHVVCQLIYLNEGPIEFSERGIAGRCNQHVLAFRKHLDVLLDLGKLTLENGKLSNNRVATELQRIDNHREISARGGRNSAGVPKSIRDKLLKNQDTATLLLLEEERHKTRLDKTREERKQEGASAPLLFEEIPPPESKAPDARVFSRCREVLKSSKDAGWIAKRLLEVKGNIPAAMAAIEVADGKDDPKTYLLAMVKKRKTMTGDAEVVWRDNLV